MSVTPLPTKLAGITEREAIADAVYRAVLAFDHNNEDLLRSAVTEDATFEFKDILACKGMTELKEKIYDRVSKLDTLHMLSNVRVNMEGDNRAKVSCSAVATHCRAGQGIDPNGAKYTSGALYLCDVVKEGALWKVSRWEVQVIWLRGDPSVMSGE
jgi:hypothetical protein